MAEHATTYPPLDVLKSIADNLWIVDSGPLWVAGMIPAPVRMTVIRLRSGEMLLHSPTQWTDLLQRDIENFGPVRHLLAPNPFHWSFIREWKRRCPEAKVWAAEGTRSRLLVRLKGPSIDGEVGDDAPSAWSDDLAHIVIRGKLVFSELAFFHRGSRTAILTDLVVNLDPEKTTGWQRPGVSAVGALGPEGRAPVYARIDYRMNGQKSRAAARRVLAWNAQRVIFSHGRWYERDGAARLARSLAWLAE